MTASRRTSRSGSRADGPALRCCFSDALARRVAGCTEAQKSSRHYRRQVDCLNRDAYGRCAAWLEQVRRASRFALGTRHTPGALARTAAGKLQCGGLLGMGDVLEGSPVERVDDVADLLRRAVARYRTFDRIPLQPVIRRMHEDHSGDG